jgi:hypothetical protein
MIIAKVCSKQRHADGRDQRCQPWRVAQRPVGQLLDGEVECRTDHHGDHGGQQQHHPAGQIGRGAGHPADDGPAGQGADHEHIAVREVDQADDAVHHRVPQRHQRIHTAQNQTVDDLLQQNVHEVFSVFLTGRDTSTGKSDPVPFCGTGPRVQTRFNLAKNPPGQTQKQGRRRVGGGL